MPRLEVALLGPVEARLGGRLVALAGERQRAVLARLAASPGRVVPASSFLEALWPGEPPANATGNLQSYVSRLRAAIGPEWLLGGSAGYQLAVAPDQVDATRLEQLVAGARTRAPSDPDGAAALLLEALALWRGEPLADLADGVAFAPDVARWESLRRQALAHWAELRLDVGAAAEVLPALEQAAAAAPGEERVHLLLARALHQEGRTAEALRTTDAYRRRLAEQSGLDPSPALRDLERRILADEPELRGRSRPTHPSRGDRRRAPADRFVGRDAELASVRAALDRCPVVTVVGPGGVGKTRITWELLDRAGSERAAHVVELGEVREPGDVAAAVATALGLQVAPGGVAHALADRLDLEPALLVLDNCEHVLDAAAALAGDLVARVPGLRVLATSRQRLGVAGEQVVRLGPLPEDDQVALFCDRAAQGRADFAATPEAKRTAAEICRLVDGLPLAVELAARREAVFGLEQLRHRLGAGLDVLDPARGGDRSTGVTATVEWSYRLLDPDVQALLDRLAVCSGGFPVEALDHLVPEGAAHPHRLLVELVEASLVVPDLSVDPPRYRLLEPTRLAGLGHLGAGAAAAARAAHARWMAEHVRHLRRLQDERSPQASASLRAEQGNLREALAWLPGWSPQDAADLAVALILVLVDDPQLELLAAVGALAPGPGALDDAGAVAAVAASGAAWIGGDTGAAEGLATRALSALDPTSPVRWAAHWFRAIARLYGGDAPGTERDVAAVLAFGGAPLWARTTAVCLAALVDLFAGRREEADRWVEEHAALLVEGPGDPFVAYTRAELAAARDPEAALQWFEEAARWAEAAHHHFTREVANVGRTAVLLRLGRLDAAVESARGPLERLPRMGMWPQVWTTLRLTAELLAARGDAGTATALLAAADADALAPAVFGPDRDRQEQLAGALEGALGPLGAAAARAEGAAGGRVGAVRRALAALDGGA